MSSALHGFILRLKGRRRRRVLLTAALVQCVLLASVWAWFSASDEPAVPAPTRSWFSGHGQRQYAFSALGLSATALAAWAALVMIRRSDRHMRELNRKLDLEVKHRVEQVLRTRNALIFGLAKLADYRDSDTGRHLERISRYSGMLGIELRTEFPEIAENWLECLGVASSLHDIGKVGIPDAILLKPGRLTGAERKLMEQHSRIGSETLRAIRQRMGADELLDMGIAIAHEHHERWEGGGYPEGLRGEKISLAARIVALADVYDAMTTKRVYKDAVSHEQTRAAILNGRGSHFDPRVVDAFERIQDQFDHLRRETGASDINEEPKLKRQAA